MNFRAFSVAALSVVFLTQCGMFSQQVMEVPLPKSVKDEKKANQEEVGVNTQAENVRVSLPSNGLDELGKVEHRAPRPEGMREPEVTTNLPLNLDGLAQPAKKESKSDILPKE